MPSSSLLTLIDDIATLLDDVAVMTKVAAKQTAGVLGDDLALNAAQVNGVHADRELPVVWAVCKGSFWNKLILVPSALAISAFEFWLQNRGYSIPLIMPLLLLGGAYLCFEGAEKLLHKLFHKASEDEAHYQELVSAVTDSSIDLVQFEKEKIQGAIRTDFILSAEIIVITLGAVASSGMWVQIGALSAIAVLMTVGVYGLVAGIVKLDDVGLYFIQQTAQSVWHNTQRACGNFLLWLAPKLMHFLSIAGTAAMFMVGGGIFTHNVAFLHHLIAEIASILPNMDWLISALLNALFGVLLGVVVVAILHFVQKIVRRNHN